MTVIHFSNWTAVDFRLASHQRISKACCTMHHATIARTMRRSLAHNNHLLHIHCNRHQMDDAIEMRVDTQTNHLLIRSAQIKRGFVRVRFCFVDVDVETPLWHDGSCIFN